MIFRNDIIECFKVYTNLSPLDMSSSEGMDTWVEDYQLNILEYSRIVSSLRSCNHLDDIVTADFDYDNLFIIIESLIQSGYLEIMKDGTYVWRGLEKNKNLITETSKVFTIPNSDYNQFPCNLESKKKRVELFFENYPYVKEMKIGIIGDDDLLSIELFKTGIYIPIVYEIDKRLIDIISSESNNCIQIVEGDLLKINTDTSLSLDTFISDPPYNLNGLINFTNFGLSCINNSTREFYLIFNSMMVGGYYFDFLNDLMKKEIYLMGRINGFSIYNFPKHYRELHDINKKLSKYHCAFTENNISSSSSLFHFKMGSKTNKQYSDAIYSRSYK